MKRRKKKFFRRFIEFFRRFDFPERRFRLGYSSPKGIMSKLSKA